MDNSTYDPDTRVMREGTPRNSSKHVTFSRDDLSLDLGGTSDRNITLSQNELFTGHDRDSQVRSETSRLSEGRERSSRINILGQGNLKIIEDEHNRVDDTTRDSGLAGIGRYRLGAWGGATCDPTVDDSFDFDRSSLESGRGVDMRPCGGDRQKKDPVTDRGYTTLKGDLRGHNSDNRTSYWDTRADTRLMSRQDKSSRVTRGELRLEPHDVSRPGGKMTCKSGEGDLKMFGRKVKQPPNLAPIGIVHSIGNLLEMVVR